MSTDETQDTESTAVAKREDSGDAAEKLGAEGRARLERIRETRELSKSIKGIQFGDVNGAGLPAATRYQIAKMCLVMGAEPSQHVDILGGRPYFNAAYWAEEINSHPRYVNHNQREISERTEEQLRETAAEKEELADDFEEKGLEDRARRVREEAADLLEEATELPLLREKFGVPEWATHAVVTTIERFVSSAPMEEIHAGRQDPDPWIKEVQECNWAGGKGEHKRKHESDNTSFSWDPIGDANPGKTARTRSLRRAAVKAFPAWREKFNQYREKIERLIEREQALMAEEGADVPDGGPQAVSTGNGEPELASPAEARALPEGGEEPEAVSEDEASEAEPAPAPSASSTAPGETDDEGEDDEDEELSPVDIERRAYFANLRDGPGITEDEARYAWQEEQGLPSSTKEWELAHWRQANRTLTAEAREEYQQACEALDIDPDAFAEGHLDRPAKMIRDYEQLTEKLEETPVGDEAEEASESGQGDLL